MACLTQTLLYAIHWSLAVVKRCESQETRSESSKFEPLVSPEGVRKRIGFFYRRTCAVAALEASLVQVSRVAFLSPMSKVRVSRW